MDPTQGHESTARALFASAKVLDPKSAEFFDACQALTKQSGGRRSRAIANASVETSPVSDARGEAVMSPQQPSAPKSDDESDSAALREARRREGQVRTELQTLHTELTNVRTRYNETVAALEEASQRASQARTEFGNAMTAISERDAAINQMRQTIVDQNQEINELQRRLIEAEEARIADASAILDSLDKYRA